ncbi:hypothetical protein GCM10011571_09300 [Marinithermofilum abyssi]|uniref:Lipoprotein n=1 Tax=Marinithermofilum abyssi TaxID=1571185 RepID=A0A8J2YAB1_9BACL|nr:PCYCGC motif-containing (lipo)protein [Marinithermofilum abyssi]GGE10112.1 hypothetical protein GCM10011571_09300 [Marinithermofilum abyssi]
MKKGMWLFSWVLIVVLAVAGCSSASTDKESVGKQAFPDFVEASQVPGAKKAYAYAANHSKQLEHIPCYCGCGSLGHDSVKSCFLKKEGGKPEFNDHGANCGVCVNVVLDTMKGKQDGMSLKEVRKEIEEKYENGMNMSPTDTPEPPKGM